MPTKDYELDLWKFIDLDRLHPSMKKWVQDILNSRACQKSRDEDFCDIQPWRNN